MTQQVQQFIAAMDLPEPGQPLADGKFIARYWINGQDHALILPDVEFSGAWGEYGVDIAGATSYVDGEANTRAMAEAGSEIAIKALDLGLFVPSCLQGQILMTAQSEGLIDLRGDRFHWLSTQSCNYDAYTMDFEDGWLANYAKNNERLVRLVRSLPIKSDAGEVERLRAELKLSNELLEAQNASYMDWRKENTTLRAQLAGLLADMERIASRTAPVTLPIHEFASAAIADALAGNAAAPCKTCNGTKHVDDGELTHSEGGIAFENGPIKCVKDCPDCTAPGVRS